MRALLIVVSAPILQFFPGVFKAHEPVSVQALGPEPAIERFDKRIVRWLSRPGEVQRHAVGIGPEVEIARDELRSLVDTDRPRDSRPVSRPAQPSATTSSARQLNRRSLTGAQRERRVDHRQHPDLPAHRQLIVDEAHRPGLVRLHGTLAVFAQLRLHQALGRFVPLLQA